MDEHAIIVECDDCTRRYMRVVQRLAQPEQGQSLCECGAVLGVWNGRYRFDFEPEDADPNW